MRTPAQIRLEAAWHEASHAVAMYLQGQEIDHLELMRPDEIREDGLAGLVQGAPCPITTIGDAVDSIVELLAGEGGFRIAWAAGMLGNEEVGGEEIEPPVELLAAMPNGHAARATELGWYERDDHPDEKTAKLLAKHFTSGPLEAELLLKFARARTTGMVETPRFQALAGDLARVLLKRSPLPGEDAVAVLQRADRLYEINA